jgi:hypothetical protein
MSATMLNPDDPQTPFNTHIRISLRRRLREVAEEHGISQRAALELAIIEKWGPSDSAVQAVAEEAAS